MTVAKHTSPPFIYSGLSSDTKPDATPLSVFIETDTGDQYQMLTTWTKNQDALSQYITMTTLLAGENYADWIGGFIQVAGGAPCYEEVDLSGSTQLNAFSTEKKLILGIRYWGITEGDLYFMDADDNITSIHLFDSRVHGVQREPIQAKIIYNQGASGAPTDVFPTATYPLGVYMTKAVTA